MLNNCLTYKGFLNIICAGVLSYLKDFIRKYLMKVYQILKKEDYYYEDDISA